MILKNGIVERNFMGSSVSFFIHSLISSEDSSILVFHSRNRKRRAFFRRTLYMKYAKTLSASLVGGFQIETTGVEVSIRQGLPTFRISGLHQPNTRETGERILSALRSSGIYVPHMTIMANLSPVDVKKRGGQFDLPLAVSILMALGDLDLSRVHPDITGQNTLFLGELSLSGEILETPLLLPYLLHARSIGIENVVVPKKNVRQAEFIKELNVFGIDHLRELLASPLSPTPVGSLSLEPGVQESRLDFLHLSLRVKRAIAASVGGWHHLLLIGPPGTGKSSLTREMSAMLPPPEETEMMEILNIQNLLEGKLPENHTLVYRPFRMPHHSITSRAMIGGGSPVEPGEVTRAHNGMLILDEYPEFSRNALQALREPMQEKEVLISRGGESIALPARFLLVATANPCPCGNLKSNVARCICSPAAIRNYRNRLMGPLRDRIEMEVPVLKEDQPDKTYGMREMIRDINRIRKKQETRYSNTEYHNNSDVRIEDLDRFIPFTDDAEREYQKIKEDGRISFRAMMGIRRLARTFADLDGADDIIAVHLQEASSYRNLEDYWRDPMEDIP